MCIIKCLSLRYHVTSFCSHSDDDTDDNAESQTRRRVTYNSTPGLIPFSSYML